MSEETIIRTAVVTGGSRGIGRAVCIQLAKQGCNVVVNYCHGEAAAAETVALCKAENANAVAVQADVSTAEGCKALFEQAVNAFGRVDILVNNAGVAHGGLFQMTGMSKVREVFDSNLFSMMELTQLLLRYMMRRRHASIINLGSVLGLDMPVGSCAYGLSKAAVMAFTRTLAAECGHLRIRVNAVAPGLVDTEMADQMESKAEEAMIAQCAMKRRAKPEEIAKMVVFLASEESSFVNGQIIRIDGGKV